jgi:Nif-specific regulatory protein
MNQHQIDDASFERLKEISTWVSSINDLDRLLVLITETANKVMDTKASSLLLLDKKTQKLYFKVATGERKDQVKDYEINVGQGIAGVVAQSGESLLINDVSKDPRWYKDISDAIGFETRSIACVPMKKGTEILGVMQVIDKNDGSSLNNDDMDFLKAYADLAASALGNAKDIAEVKQQNEHLKAALGQKHQLIGVSDKLNKAVSDALKVASSNASVLISGESGTGKELLARLIHRESARKDQPLVALNCAALPETLLEDELFGHEKGAYTGAVGRKIGKFELSDGGTIFLDEIGEMIPGMQAKLLRVLQEGVFYRVGGNTPISVDVRVISATNRNIEDEVGDGRFREDLFYRLNVIHIHMPALRERKDDIPSLVNHFVEIFSNERGLQRLPVAKRALEKINKYDWPGNVRELRNALERAVVMGDGLEVLPEDLFISASQTQPAGFEVGITLEEALNAFKKEFIAMNLEYTGGNRSKAAKIMDIQRTYLSRLISKYELRNV